LGVPRRDGRSWHQRLPVHASLLCARFLSVRHHVWLCVTVCARAIQIVFPILLLVPSLSLRRGFYHNGEDEQQSEGKRTYYRVLEVDASEDGAADKLTGIFDTAFCSNTETITQQVGTFSG
jgi:hypothetical protein